MPKSVAGRSPIGALLVLLLCAPDAARAQASHVLAFREHLSRGVSLFKDERYEDAIEEFQAAYAIRPDNNLLFNIGKAHLKLRRCGEALRYLQRYERALRSPSVRERADLTAARGMVEECLRQERPDQKPPDQKPPDQKPPDQKPPNLPPRHRNIDIGLSAGLALWLVGGSGSGDSSAALALSGGYTVRPLSPGPLETRLGLKLAYGHLVDTSSLVSVISVLFDPLFRVRLWREQLFLRIEPALGAVLITGLANGSVLLVDRTRPTGTLAQFELRPALGLEYRVAPSFAVSLSPTVIYNPQPSPLFAASSLLRFEISAGGTLYF